MNKTIRAYLDFVRFPNLFTAAADILAGYFFVFGEVINAVELTRLIVGSVCLYAGGVALNDVCDVEKDTRERPTRPIPSGAISLARARVISIALILIGAVTAGSTSMRAAVISAALVIAIVLYDSVLKATIAAPTIMGLCRALNLALGMSVADLTSPSVSPPCAMMWLYVTSLTFFARHEAVISKPLRLKLGAVGVGVACLGLIVIGNGPIVAVTVPNVAIIVVGCFLMLRGLSAADDPQPALVQSAVKTFVMFIIVFDALVTVKGASAREGVIVLSLMIPAMFSARLLRVT